MFKGRSFTVTRAAVTRIISREIVPRLRALMKTDVRVNRVELFGQITCCPIFRKALKPVFKSLDPGMAAADGASHFGNTKIRRAPILDRGAFVRAAGNRYPIFSRNDNEEKNPVIVARVNRNSVFEVIDEANGEVFLRFTADVGPYGTDVEVSFMQNAFLMPVPISASANGRKVELKFENCGWEVTEGDIRKAEREMDNYAVESTRWSLWGEVKRGFATIRGMFRGSGRDRVLGELHNLVMATQITGERVDDVERWIEREKDTASVSQIRAKIRELEARNRRHDHF
jgi:hypothetical protein